MIDTEMMINEILDRIIRTTNQAIYESETALDDPEKGYAYAAGYARQALKMVLDDVNYLKSLVPVEQVSTTP